MDSKNKTRNCPYCKEQVKLDAVKCKHCLSSMNPSHDGICPYCKEEINVEAIKCKHCKSDLNLESEKLGQKGYDIKVSIPATVHLY